MKKLGLILFGIILGVIGCYFYCSNCNVALDEPETSIVKPAGIITSKQAEVLSTAYTPRYELVSDSIFGAPNSDNRSSWYSLVDVKNYLRYADSQATALGYEMNGIRIYLGAHADGKTPGYTTMFMVPTGEESVSTASSFPLKRVGNGDIPGGDGLNDGDNGMPPSATYPQ